MPHEPIDLPAAATTPIEVPAQVIHVLEETARVEKREVETGRASIRIRVSEHDEAIQTLLKRQDVVVERIPVDRMVSEAPPIRQEGTMVIVPVMEERVVVEKRLFIKEELHIRINEAEHMDTQVLNLRREQADITHSAPDTVPAAS